MNAAPEHILRTSAAAQLLLPFIGLALLRILHWPAEWRRLQSLTRQSCWAHFVYLLLANGLMAIVALIEPAEFLNGSTLAIAATLWASIYASSRIVMQTFVFDRSLTRQGMGYRLGEVALMGNYAVMAAGYGFAAWVNLKGSIDLA